jgi:hypothetical protein
MLTPACRAIDKIARFSRKRMRMKGLECDPVEKKYNLRG